jgi:hypothetical protein
MSLLPACRQNMPSLNIFNYLLINADQMLDLINHTPHRWRIFKITGAADFIQAKTDQRLALVAFAADSAFGLRYPNC